MARTNVSYLVTLVILRMFFTISLCHLLHRFSESVLSVTNSLFILRMPTLPNGTSYYFLLQPFQRDCLDNN
jgi:hypothetical protein